MRLLDRLERRLRGYSVPNVTLYFIAGQVVAYIASQTTHPQILVNMALVPALVLQGQVWRLASFLFTPPCANPVFAFFFWYMFYLMGTALEAHWGAFRYNLFLLIGWLATVGVSFITPEVPASPGFLQGSVFLAFAFLFPDFVLYLFFILPVKIKWLALLTWIGYFSTVVFGDWSSRLLVLASVINFLLFFGERIYARMRFGHRRMLQQAGRVATQDKPFHRCTVCGITDRTHPDMEFRYCSKCDGQHGYCREHIRNHEHVVADQSSSSACDEKGEGKA